MEKGSDKKYDKYQWKSLYSKRIYCHDDTGTDELRKIVRVRQQMVAEKDGQIKLFR